MHSANVSEEYVGLLVDVLLDVTQAPVLGLVDDVMPVDRTTAWRPAFCVGETS